MTDLSLQSTLSDGRLRWRVERANGTAECSWRSLDAAVESLRGLIEREELLPVFDSICNSQDWRAPINTFCKSEDRERVRRAIEYFTGTTPTFIGHHGPHSGNTLRVIAAGYLAGPAGS